MIIEKFYVIKTTIQNDEKDTTVYYAVDVFGMPYFVNDLKHNDIKKFTNLTDAKSFIRSKYDKKNGILENYTGSPITDNFFILKVVTEATVSDWY